jgi:hypothetical protein
MKIENLLKTNVNDHVEKKNNLSYLSWAWAWAEALKADQKATFKVEMFGDKCFMDINGTAMVWVTVTIFDKPMTCQLPVMDYKNKAIPNPDAFAVNTAIMRCMTKALSLHGLGLYIYAGEDLPEKEQLAVNQISEQDLNIALNSVAHAQTLDDLKSVYTEAIKFCGSDDAAKAHVIAVKNQRKEELSA